MKKTELRAKDWVEVKSPREIEETLASDGTLDGLPFMPEMLEHCGKRYQVIRRAHKTCIETAGGYLIRAFLRDDVVLLGELRCSGADHDGCQRRCMFFWKEAWLRKIDPMSTPTNPLRSAALQDLRSRLKTKDAPERYFCQSTELIRSTRSQPLRKSEILLNCVRDVRSGAVRTLEMVALILVPAARKFRDAVLGRPRLVGPLTRTPKGDLELHPGELVEIKSAEEVRKTLDRKGRNRGLVFDIELVKTSCGTRHRVAGRLERIISESTGQMRLMDATVILGDKCMCARVVGGCPRQDFCYWREVWLKRVNEPVSRLPAQESVNTLQAELLPGHEREQPAEVTSKMGCDAIDVRGVSTLGPCDVETLQADNAQEGLNASFPLGDQQRERLEKHANSYGR